jgi:hypothetical protein
MYLQPGAADDQVSSLELLGGDRRRPARRHLPAARLASHPREISTGSGGLAGLYAGTPLSTLRIAGLGSGGDPRADDLLDAAFATRPFMLDYF